MKWQPYPEYKDSGVDWLGKIPAHWGETRLAFIFSQFNAGEVIDKSYWGEGYELLFTCARYPVTSDFPEFPDNKRTGQNDLLLTRNGTPYVHLPPTGSIYSNVIERITLKSAWDRLFCSYALSDSCLHLKGYGVSIESLNFEMWKALRLAAPPLSEQRAIAAFLDRETGRIDALIAKKQRQIELLQEKRAALISHAVTRGIPGATHLEGALHLKDSGIEWLGEIPAHWSVVRLGYFARVLNGSTPRRSRPDYWIDGTIPWLSSGKVNDDMITEPSEWITEAALRESSLEVVPAGSAVIGLVGQGRTRGMAAFMGIDAAINQNMAAIIPGPKLRGRFIQYVLEHMYSPIRESGRGANQAALNCEIVADLRLPLPPVSEQESILDYLDAKSERISHIRARIEDQVAAFQEYRTALISAAVTGKIDVRDQVQRTSEVRCT